MGCFMYDGVPNGQENVNDTDELSTRKNVHVSWLRLFKSKSSKTSLSDILSKEPDFCFNIIRVPGEKLLTTKLQYIMDVKTRGKYICVLKDTNFNDQYAVGIDCDSTPKYNWDCYNTTCLELTVHNLAKCVGPNNNFL